MEHGEPIAGPGCPEVAEFCFAELGAVLGMSTTAAKRLVGHALELRHRLPRLWAATHAGTVPPWRARRIAEATIHTTPTLTPESAGWVDRQVTPFAARIGTAQLDRLLASALARQGTPPDTDDPEDPTPVKDTRHVTLDDGGAQVSSSGTIRITGELDLADAYDLDHALKEGAATLKALGSDTPLDARRAMALGELARHQRALDLHVQDNGQANGPGAAAPDGVKLPAARRLDLHLHLSASAVASGKHATGAGLAWDSTVFVEEGQRLALLQHVKDWLGDSHTEIRVLPVIDLAEEITISSYTPSPRLQRQVQLRDGTCVFPHCSRPARRCDLDHVIPYDHDAAAEGRPQPGPTTTSNLACLCRRHHRLKTHGRWRLLALASGVCLWTSPHGHHFLRDRTGTRPLDLGLDGAVVSRQDSVLPQPPQPAPGQRRR
ncbi:DUF222 domain-containing protein [Nocardioides gansuensis]|uniref:DUF222 domain-containing protein n=1 Tax=Nocardioides gansuensis TaxID=2138300 RepID=A0A2T8FB80_9ACTN|nr:HNH endonuclease signature motif containing protein [Nocardioides gansuensis]PVG82960.1 DUF222 domain-containing protein [Nocardioides gansuensis]